MTVASFLAATVRHVERSKILSLVFFSPSVSKPSVAFKGTGGPALMLNGFVLSVILGTFRGMAQVSFANNVISGILILVACFVSDSRLARML